ncbi:hypothetical protein P4K44_33450 [Bacillus cereus]|uniref:hypothetical protein n=1 Tax=Bacillus pumilus TaxID=1408 RepID=UPI002DB5B6F0|nr:hypothetical protein [Bacillus pumilus]MEB9770406.1 hypothetical protein [Bacillus cereus]MED1527902.1 hypothetical protein [Bacillus pumilus]
MRKINTVDTLLIIVLVAWIAFTDYNAMQPIDFAAVVTLIIFGGTVAIKSLIK